MPTAHRYVDLAEKELVPVREVAGEAEVRGVRVVQNRNQLILRDATFQQRRPQKHIQEAVHDAAKAAGLISEGVLRAYRMVQPRCRFKSDAMIFALCEELCHRG